MVKMVPYEAFACPYGAGDVVLRESYRPKTHGKVVNYTMHVHDQSLVKTLSDANFFMKRGMSPSTGWFFWSFNDSNLFSKIFIDSNLFSRSSTPLRYSPRASTPQSYSPRTLRNTECSNCKHLLDKMTVLEATVDMHMHPEQHTVNSAALFHEVYNNMGKLDLE
uniref:Uncharacterized protein n=1 Tax=Tanacetum cinerariifolium TaxID=118510 RepID=A0A6L2LLK0_TANCI|nr:hypothetical protein [Tanacetum cinerariifolium]